MVFNTRNSRWQEAAAIFMLTATCERAPIKTAGINPLLGRAGDKPNWNLGS